MRDTALRAGQRIVNMYADTAITLLLPELERGLFDDNWRIRYSSVQLLGDLLYKISGKLKTKISSVIMKKREKTKYLRLGGEYCSLSFENSIQSYG